MSKLAKILEQEYRKKGVISGSSAAVGKKALEMIDIRNLLFSGTGITSIIGKKIFGKGYSAAGQTGPSVGSKIMSSSPIASSESIEILISIKKDTRITAKNSVVLPGMARDMNIMRQNIIKLVKAQGDTPARKADMFFLRAKDRENLYESNISDKQISPTKETEKGETKSNSIFDKFAKLFKITLFIKLALVVGGLIVAGIALYKLFGTMKDTLIDWADRLKNYIFRNGQVDPKISGARTEDVPLQPFMRPDGTADYSVPIPTGPVADFFQDQARERSQEFDARKAAEYAKKYMEERESYQRKDYLNETKKFLMQQGEDRKDKSPTPISGLDLLNRVMDRQGIYDEELRKRIIQLASVESNMNPNARGPIIQSGMHKGDQAHGLLQIMPKTATEVGYSREDILDPEKAATAGVKYFIKNLVKFKGNLDAATVAHHSGPGGASKFLASGDPGTRDRETGLKTIDYLKKVSQRQVPTTTSGTQLAMASQSVSDGRQEVMAPVSSTVIQDNSQKVVNNNTQTSSSIIASARNDEWNNLIEIII
jgi:soluble lytic murein transglycosylase-like protein